MKTLIAVAAVAFAGTVQVASADRADSKVSIKYLGGGEFTGKVKSSEASCVEERTVVLYKVTKDGKKRIVTDTTDADGEWNTGQTGFTKGKFYAKAKRTEDCAKALSKTIKI